MIFLTGATGNTGSRVARMLAERGAALRCLLHNPAHCEFLPKAADVVEGDVERVEELSTALAGAEACLHLAHIRFASAVIEACRNAGVQRLICLSSTRRFTRFPCESQRWVIDGEAAVERSGLRWTILRPAMIYGGGRDNNIEKLVRHFKRTSFFPLVRGGRHWVQPVYVDDVAGAVLAALDHPESAGRAYTLAGPRPLAFRRMVEITGAAMGVRPRFVYTPYSLLAAGAWLAERVAPRPPLTVEQVRRFLEDKEFKIDEAHRELGFAPISFEEGIRKKIAGLA